MNRIEKWIQKKLLMRWFHVEKAIRLERVERYYYNEAKKILDIPPEKQIDMRILHPAFREMGLTPCIHHLEHTFYWEYPSRFYPKGKSSPNLL